MNTNIYGDFQTCITVPLKCLKKTFYGTPLVVASGNGFEEFLRISKGGLHGTICKI